MLNMDGVFCLTMLNVDVVCRAICVLHTPSSVLPEGLSAEIRMLIL
jgi:hypothetical protein